MSLLIIPDGPERPVQAVPLAVGVMTPGQRLTAALKALRWTYGDLAVALGASPSTTRNWGLGRSPVPPQLLAWAERRAEAMLADPPPRVRG